MSSSIWTCPIDLENFPVYIPAQTSKITLHCKKKQSTPRVYDTPKVCVPHLLLCVLIEFTKLWRWWMRVHLQVPIERCISTTWKYYNEAQPQSPFCVPVLVAYNSDHPHCMLVKSLWFYSLHWLQHRETTRSRKMPFGWWWCIANLHDQMKLEEAAGSKAPPVRACSVIFTF